MRTLGSLVIIFTLFFSNSIRFAAAMSGADYGTFDNGRWYASKNLREMQEWLERAKPAQPKKLLGGETRH